MNSSKHAAQSAMIFGGLANDYLSIHEMIDMNKNVSFSVFTRFFLHHIDVGGQILEDIFGKTIQNSDKKDVAVMDLMLQHLIEDYDQVPVFNDWAKTIDAFGALKISNVASHEIVFEKIVKNDLFQSFKIEDLRNLCQIVDDYFNLRPYMLIEEISVKNGQHLIFCHALGLHLLEKVFQTQLRGLGGSPCPIDQEFLVHYYRAKFSNTIPTLLDYEEIISKKPWMLAPDNKESGRLDPVTVKKKIDAFWESKKFGITKGAEVDFEGEGMSIFHRESCNLD